MFVVSAVANSPRGQVLQEDGSLSALLLTSAASFFLTFTSGGLVMPEHPLRLDATPPIPLLLKQQAVLLGTHKVHIRQARRSCALLSKSRAHLSFCMGLCVTQTSVFRVVLPISSRTLEPTRACLQESTVPLRKMEYQDVYLVSVPTCIHFLGGLTLTHVTLAQLTWSRG